MALTQFSDLFASIHENAINNVVLQLQRQRPSLFNYGTDAFVRKPDRLCFPLLNFIDADVTLFNNPIVHKESLLAIPGYNGPYGMEYCLQLRELSIDIHPPNAHSLPPELVPLEKQRFSLKGKACAGLGCPERGFLNEIAPIEEPFFPVLDLGKDVTQPHKEPPKENPDDRGKEEPPKPPDRPVIFDRPICFCLDLFAVFHLEMQGSSDNPILALKLDNLEMVDIKPEGMENMVECFIKTVIVLSLLPKVRLALKALVFNIAEVLTIEPTPISASVPFNPALEDDQIKVFVNLKV
jgi:hypothetical protein